jgi:hypothetical protein
MLATGRFVEFVVLFSDFPKMMEGKLKFKEEQCRAHVKDSHVINNQSFLPLFLVIALWLLSACGWTQSLNSLRDVIHQHHRKDQLGGLDDHRSRT